MKLIINIPDYRFEQCQKDITTLDLFEELVDAIKNGTPQDPFINKPCVSDGVCEHDKQKVLDKIRAEIEELDDKLCRQFLIEDADKEMHHAYRECLEIIDKYKAESEERNADSN